MLTDPLDASPRQAAQTLEDLARLRRRRRRLGAPWFALVCFGALTMLSAPLIAVTSPAALLPLWVVGGAGGMLLMRHYYRRRARQRGVTGRGRRAWTVGVVMFVTCLAAEIAIGLMNGGETASLTTPIVMTLAGYLALGWLARDPVPSLAIVPGAALAAALALAGLAPWIVELTFGATLVAVGAGLRVAQERS